MRGAAYAFVMPSGLVLAACGMTAPAAELEVAEVDTQVASATVTTLTTAELADLIDKGNVRLIDVRRDDEVAEGMIPGAEHIVLDSFDPAALDLSDGREVLLYCRSGRRSGIAAERLAAHTGEPVRHLDGGFMAWKDAGKPVAIP